MKVSVTCYRKLKNKNVITMRRMKERNLNAR